MYTYNSIARVYLFKSYERCKQTQITCENSLSKVYNTNNNNDNTTIETQSPTQKPLRDDGGDDYNDYSVVL